MQVPAQTSDIKIDNRKGNVACCFNNECMRLKHSAISTRSQHALVVKSKKQHYPRPSTQHYARERWGSWPTGRRAEHCTHVASAQGVVVGSADVAARASKASVALAGTVRPGRAVSRARNRIRVLTRVARIAREARAALGKGGFVPEALCSRHSPDTSAADAVGAYSAAVAGVGRATGARRAARAVVAGLALLAVSAVEAGVARASAGRR